MINNTHNNINLKTEYKRLKIFTILMALEAEMPTILIMDPHINIYIKALSSLMYLPSIISILSYKYNKKLIEYRISKYNNVKYKNNIKYTRLYLIMPAIIYFIISPVILIITLSIFYLMMYDIIGFIIFILDFIIINKNISHFSI